MQLKLNNIISKKTKKEIARYAISFFFAWLLSALISDFPFFKSLFIQSLGIDVYLIKILSTVSSFTLNIIGIETLNIYDFIMVANTPGMYLRYGCLGFREYAFFIGFIALQYGSFKNKLWYIPAGVVTLTLLNIIRIVIIAIGQYYDPYKFQIVHDVVSPVLMYPAILFLWLYWLHKYGKTNSDVKKV